MEPLAQLAIMWCGAWAAGLIAEKTKLTSALWCLVFGAVMVNVGGLPTTADPFIRDFAELGIILIMFALGFEENTKSFLQSIKRSWGIAFFGALAPFLTAFGLTYWFWGNTSISVMCGLTMTATAVSLTMVSLKGLGLQRSRAATGIMTSAVLDDLASLALVAILVPIATGESAADLVAISWIVGKAMIFFAGVGLVGAVLLPHRPRSWFQGVQFLWRFGARDLLAAGRGEHSTLFVLLFALLVGLIAHKFGFHPAVGAYMAGLILSEEYFLFDRKGGRSSYARTKTVIDNAAFSWIGPVFFVALGTKLTFDADVLVSVVPEMLALTAALFVAQVVSAAVAARYTGNFSFHESVMIGFGMLGRAELAFVVLDIAYVENQILSTEAFYTLMLTAFCLNILVPVTITWWKPRYDAAAELAAGPGAEEE